MPNFLNGLFQTKDIRNNATTRALSNRVTSGSYNVVQSGYGTWDLEQGVTQGYERVIWIYRCIDAIASNASSVPMVVREYDDVDGGIVQDPALHKLLNRRANKYETAQQFRYRLATQLLLSRTGAFVEVVRNRQGRPIELHLLPPTSVTPVPDAKNYISHYEVKSATEGMVQLPPERVLWIRVKPHPTDPYAQTTPLVSAGLAADTDFLARLYNRNFLANDGRPGMLVGVRGQMSREDAEEIRRRFSGGPLSAGSTTVIEADGIDVNDMSTSPRDAMYLEAIAGAKSDILLAFGVPESVLGNAANRTFDNADAEFEIFWTTTMLPFLDAIGAGFDKLTVGGDEDEYFVAHDYSKVDVLQRRKRERHDKALSEYREGLLTIDEYLEIVGRKPLDVAGTKVLWLPTGKVPVGQTDEVTKEAQALQQVGMGAPVAPAPVVPSAPITDEQRDSFLQRRMRALQLSGEGVDVPPLAEAPQEGAEQETKSLNQPMELKAKPHPYEGDRTSTEAEIAAVMSAWSRRQERVILERLGSTKTRLGTRHWEGDGAGVKRLRGSYIVDVNKWGDELINDLDETLMKISKRHAQRLAIELRNEGVIDAILRDGRGNPNGRSALAKIVGDGQLAEGIIENSVEVAKNMIRESAIRQSEKLIEIITQMDKDGASIEEIKREVRRRIGSRSSWKQGLATAATTAVIEGSRNAVLQQCSNYISRTWVTIKDEKTRTSHWKADGQTRKSGKPFRVGTSLINYPGDPTAPISETANCRCWIEWDVNSDKVKRKRSK